MNRHSSSKEGSSPRAALSVIEFCHAYGISRAFFYVLLRDGTGPRVMRVRGRLLISSDAAQAWQRQLEGAQR